MKSPKPDVIVPAKRPADRRRAAAAAPSLAVDRLAQMVTAALGPAQRAWLLGRKASPVDSAAAMARGGVLQRGRAQAMIERILDASLDLLTAPGTDDRLPAMSISIGRRFLGLGGVAGEPTQTGFGRIFRPPRRLRPAIVRRLPAAVERVDRRPGAV